MSDDAPDTEPLSAREITRRLAAACEWSYSRSSGPGGQNRDHVETRAVVVLRASDLGVLDADLADLLRRRLALNERPLRLWSQAARAQRLNREIVIARLEQRIEAALAGPPPPRRPTRPSRAAKQRRLAAKAHRAGLKAGRRPPSPEG